MQQDVWASFYVHTDITTELSTLVCAADCRENLLQPGHPRNAHWTRCVLRPSNDCHTSTVTAGEVSGFSTRYKTLRADPQHTRNRTNGIARGDRCNPLSEGTTARILLAREWRARSDPSPSMIKGPGTLPTHCIAVSEPCRKSEANVWNAAGNDAEFRQAEKDWHSFVEHMTDKLMEIDDTIPELPIKDVVRDQNSQLRLIIM